jgi:cell filamentation protein
MASPDFVDPYLDPTTGLLRNRVGADTKVALDKAEGDLSFARMLQLMDHPPRPSGDLAELQEIHRQLFQDVYAWAGELRTVDIRKNTEGAEFFLPVSMIERASMFATDELRSENMLKGLSREQFVDRLAYHYDQVNYIHPFREGNGRTQRVFWNRIARDAGWQLDWRSVHGRTNDEASRVASEKRDFGPLRAMFDQITTKAMPATERDAAWLAAEHARLSFPSSANSALGRSVAGNDAAASAARPASLGRGPAVDREGRSR